MTQLIETDTFSSNVTQIDKGEKIKGGITGVSNRALLELTNRSRYLYNSSINLRKFNQAASSLHTIDCSETNKWIYFPVTANTTVNMTNLEIGCVIYIEMDDAGSYTITWQAESSTSNIKWDGSVEPPWAAAGKRSIACFISPDGTSVYGKIIYDDLDV